ncbi:hypothetical protein [Methylobacterium oryzihabitans]|uniref:Uncharacterized protein n=1 Tax=Methylobacterium oryzihabitans TaxID=2499852 RepID=A0A437NY49_9HYPH|nr:hypothetical protein [Methylobacterium oryzihabitans]RVU14949.1 hypothetical protein EOE48_21245 [Methylobacterium oryzihabitans]
MILRVAATLSAATVAMFSTAAVPARADYVLCATPWSCERVSERPAYRDLRELHAANHQWQAWNGDGPRPYTRFDIEALRLMTRMP